MSREIREGEARGDISGSPWSTGKGLVRQVRRNHRQAGIGRAIRVRVRQSDKVFRRMQDWKG